MNRKEREEREEEVFVSDTQKILCDVFAFLAVLAVQARAQPVDRSSVDVVHIRADFGTYEKGEKAFVGALNDPPTNEIGEIAGG